MKRKVKRKSFIVGASYVLLFACLFLCVCLVALNKKDGIDAYDQFVETAINSSQSEQSIVIENTTFHGADTFVCVNSGENVTIQNCSFENTSESAIVVNGGTLSIEDCSISDCAATNGGAISIASGTLNIKNTEISDNSASKGGAIFARGQDIEINIDENCVIANNSATSGGAIYLEDTSDGNTNIINLLSATFDGNNATSGEHLHSCQPNG
ncbi:MAG: right-handed parallel beta-helix repeat-containing protein [Clostridia bacterium]|nr:right-handed parallel beta-helix repeat-containing protein [Clostridia bacterium]